MKRYKTIIKYPENQENVLCMKSDVAEQTLSSEWYLSQ